MNCPHYVIPARQRNCKYCAGRKEGEKQSALDTLAKVKDILDIVLIGRMTIHEAANIDENIQREIRIIKEIIEEELAQIKREVEGK